MTDTADTPPERLPLTSMDITEEKRELLNKCLAAAFPEVTAEDKIDLDQLKRVLGEWVEPDRERFGLNWPGKAACMKVIQAPSVGTLKPCPEESVEWETTGNLFIEGDNLEVLKLLQKAYFGKVVHHIEDLALLNEVENELFRSERFDVCEPYWFWLYLFDECNKREEQRKEDELELERQRRDRS